MPSLADAYVVLGLSQGCTLEEAKAKYKQIALRTHPDKNPDNPDATVEFQRVSEAYKVISAHLESDEGEEAFWNDYDEDSDDEELMHIYTYIYSRLMNERRWSRHQYFASEKAESEAEYQEEMRRKTEEQNDEAEHRKKDKEAKMVFEKQQREKERREAEERQKKKKETKKTKAKEKRKKAKQTGHMLQQRTQTRRSAVFQAARDGEVDKVKQGIYEFSVDASGGEVRPGCEKFVKNKPKDPQETLLHIATKNGDADLVEYLDRHNAEPDERNTDGLTPVHLAIVNGNMEIIKFFFETYSPKDSDHESIYQAPEGRNLLTLASESLDSRVVEVVLSNAVWNAEEMKFAQDWISSKEMDDILAVFRRYCI